MVLYVVYLLYYYTFSFLSSDLYVNFYGIGRKGLLYVTPPPCGVYIYIFW